MTTIWHFHFWVNYPFNIKVFVQFCLVQCDEWGGAESRGNGARPVELMMMSDTCTTHRSRVPTEELRKYKRRSDDSGRRERTRPGL